MTSAARRGRGALDRRKLVAQILADRRDLLVISGLGSPCWDLAAAGDHAGNFYVWGAMGGACMMALGLALAQPNRRVLAMVGDGEMLMGLGSLATIGKTAARNLAVLVLDNERYLETGGQPTHTATTADLASVGKALGFAHSETLVDSASIPRACETLREAAGPVLMVAKISSAKAPLVLPPRDGVYLKHRFREAALGAKAVR